MSSKYLVTVILVVVAAVAGFLFGSAGSTKTGLPQITTGNQSVAKNPIFKSQTATFQGIITKVDGSELSVKDDSGNTDTFSVSSKAVIYKFTGSSSQASASSDLKSIDTDKQALVMLELIDGKYQIVSVSYLPPPPKPAAKP
ncbi:MAG: hypothetical protein G01um10147_1114 [Microgenomates group bacterium Gr01-1014_7]|nr:MAG: hypothetical protein G01um10147_1114 [Microgenomates group bacterium Gr01-1014_7]